MSKNPTTMRDHARKVLSHQQAQTEGEPDDQGELLAPDPAFEAAGPGPLAGVRRRVTLSVLGFPAGSAIVCRITEAIRESDVEDTRYDRKARVCTIEAPNGEARLLIVGEVLGTALDRAYPDAGYVGLWFHITKLGSRAGKRYAEYEVLEIEPPRGVIQAAAE